MYRFVYFFGLLLASFILSYARHTVFISHDGSKTYLPSSSEPDVCMTPNCVIAAADVLTSLDETVDPCDDFYSFACGGWMKRHEVTDKQPVINPIYKTQKDLDRKLRDLIESEYKSSDPHFVKMIKDYYNTCVDLDTIEKQGSEPLKKLLRRLGGWPVVEGSHWDESSFDWVDTLITFRKLGYDHEIMVDLRVKYDPESKTDSMLLLEDSYMGRLANANISLALDDPRIAAYYRTMVRAAKLIGAEESTAEKELLEALRFEMDLINIMSEDEDSTEEKRNKTEITVAELQKELPQVPWLKIINGLLLVNQVYENETIINGNPDFLVKFAELITSTDKRAIANFMLWRAVLESKDYLSEEWKDIDEDEEEDKSSKKSKSAEKPRWKECLSELELNMEIALSSYYVRHYFSDESKDEAMMLMKYIHKEFLKILENNDWMDEATRKKAEEKANAIKAYIGYPKELLNDTFMMKTYENITITSDSYLENILVFRKKNMDGRFSRFKMNFEEMQDIMRSSKFDSVVEVNAFYNPHENSIAIPAGILHDAFYDKDRPEYINFAVIGYVIGHEITHGFDNEGRNYDKDGKEVNWWDKESDEHFRKKVQCIIDQYDNYTTFIGLKVNGEKTQNENIADNGGLKEAYYAYHSWTEDHGIEPLLPGLNYTQNQLFWLSAAHVWCSKYQPERLKKLLVIDPHSPGKFRIIGPMSNLPEFSKDFKCSPDAPMNRKYKCHVW